ncbi:MAG: uroporphyrinogen decarboxylase [Candidatus Hydrogenedens sp.]|jgi:uroporphyrinogen decarboxylase|nr:uroporphyrinogen decarboxylase [Candidatus Hydrogenedens sp.]
MTDKKDLFMNALCGGKTARTPVWFMRQAGRCDPAYRRLRQECGLTLEELFRSPELAAEISLLPLKWGVDAVIFFQDILTILEGMGAFFRFSPGPVLENPESFLLEEGLLHSCYVWETMPFVARTFALIREEVGTEVPLLGFAGAPLTLLSFLSEGKSPSAELPALRRLMKEDPGRVDALLDLLTTMTIDYLSYQFASGVDAVQLFESCANLFSREEYRRFALPSQQRIFAALKRKGPAILFSRLDKRSVTLEDLAEAGSDVLSLPACYSIAEARACLGADLVVQGNVDNYLTADGTREEILQAVEQCLSEGESRGHILNLGHGVLPHTPLKNLVDIIECARNFRVRR